MSGKRGGDDKQMHERSDRDAVMDSLLVVSPEFNRIPWNLVKNLVKAV